MLEFPLLFERGFTFRGRIQAPSNAKYLLFTVLCGNAPTDNQLDPFSHNTSTSQLLLTNLFAYLLAYLLTHNSRSAKRLVGIWLGLTALLTQTSGYATWFTAGGAIRIAHYDVIDDVITRKL